MRDLIAMVVSSAIIALIAFFAGSAIPIYSGPPLPTPKPYVTVTPILQVSPKTTPGPTSLPICDRDKFNGEWQNNSKTERVEVNADGFNISGYLRKNGVDFKFTQPLNTVVAPNFRVAIQVTSYDPQSPQAIVGLQLDPTCSFLLVNTKLVLSNGSAEYTGIQRFDRP